MKTESFLNASIEGLQTVGHRYVIITLKVPASFQFRAGQFTQIEFSDADGLFYKYYSIASAPRPDHSFDLCLLVDDSRVWQWVRNQCIGQSLRIAPASGQFYLPAQERKLVLVAGGSGITPLKAMFEARAQLSGSAPTTLLYGCQNDLEIPFYSDLMALQARHTHVSVHFYADEVKHGRAKPGRPVDELKAFVAADTDFLLCGPPGFMKAAREALEQAGVEPERIHQDRY